MIAIQYADIHYSTITTFVNIMIYLSAALIRQVNDVRRFCYTKRLP